MLPYGMEGCPTIHTGTPRRWGIRVPMSITSF
jgi:hypothetical protein